MQVNPTNISFKAGLTKQIQQEIKNCNVSQISSIFFQNGIDNNFKENKFIAWTTLKCLELVQFLNNKYNLKFGFPKGIFVEDFKNLTTNNKNALGLTNFAPTKLYINSNKIVPEKTIFFNEFEDYNYSKGNKLWENIDLIADKNFETNITTTDFYLETFLHEFFHVIHENNLMNRLNPNILISTLQEILNPDYLKIFQQKYRQDFNKICKYASTNPLETIACDLSKRTIENLNKSTLLPEKNYISKSPYKKTSLFSLLPVLNKEPNISKTLTKFWNGVFD